jgi:hypothetical protein
VRVLSPAPPAAQARTSIEDVVTEFPPALSGAVITRVRGVKGGMMPTRKLRREIAGQAPKRQPAWRAPMRFHDDGFALAIAHWSVSGYPA